MKGPKKKVKIKLSNCDVVSVFFFNDMSSIWPTTTHPLQSTPALFLNSYDQVLILTLTPLILLQHLDERK